MTTVKYRCKRCFATHTFQMESSGVYKKKTCPYCKKLTMSFVEVVR